MEKEQTGEVVLENKNPGVNKIKLVITEEVLNELKKERININQLFCLFSLYHEAFNLLDIYDEQNQNIEVLVFDYQDLQVHGFIDDSDEIFLYKINERGKEFVERINDLMKENQEDESEEKSIDKLCHDYLELWPKVKLPSQKYARASILEIQKKMKVWLRVNKPLFKKEYGFKLNNQDILDATKAYIDRYAKTGYKFMVTSSYFIQKNEKSALCDELIARTQGLDKINNAQEKGNITTM